MASLFIVNDGQGMPGPLGADGAQADATNGDEGGSPLGQSLLLPSPPSSQTSVQRADLSQGLPLPSPPSSQTSVQRAYLSQGLPLPSPPSSQTSMRWACLSQGLLPPPPPSSQTSWQWNPLLSSQTSGHRNPPPPMETQPRVEALACERPSAATEPVQPMRRTSTGESKPSKPRSKTVAAWPGPRRRGGGSLRKVSTKPAFTLEAASDLLLYRSMVTEICRTGTLRVPLASRSDGQVPEGESPTMAVVELSEALPNWERPKLTSTRLAIVALLNLVDCINMNLLTPYAADMVSTLMGLPPNHSEVLRNVGLLIGIYNFSEMLFSPFWGKLSDSVGRRPVILMSLGGAALVPIAFGLAQSVAMAMAVRGLNGVLCGSFGITKTYVAELVDKDNEARAFSVLIACYSLGMIIGPALGGLLTSPASWSPSAAEFFSHGPLRIFHDQPFFMPNCVFTVFACIVWMLAYCFLQESLPPAEIRKIQKAAAKAARAKAKALGQQGAEEPEDTCAARCKRRMPFLAYPPQLLRAMASYGLVVGYLIATIQNIVLLTQIPTEDGGFGLTPKTLGLLQNYAAVGLLSTQLLFYPKLVKRMGYRWCVTVGLCTVLVVTLPFPLYGLLADPERFAYVRLLPLVLMIVIQQAAFGFCTPTTTVWINRFGEGQNRGEVNGWANAFAALIRALAPIVVGNLQALTANLSWTGWRYLALYAISFLGPAIALVLLPVLPKGAAAPQKAVETAADAEEEESGHTSDGMDGASSSGESSCGSKSSASGSEWGRARDTE